MDNTDFYKHVAQMRRMQNKYFSTKDKKYLIAAKEAERAVDHELHAQGFQTVCKEDRDEQTKMF